MIGSLPPIAHGPYFPYFLLQVCSTPTTPTLTPHHTQRPLYYSANKLDTLLPWGLCTCCSFCLSRISTWLLPLSPSGLCSTVTFPGWLSRTTPLKTPSPLLPSWHIIPLPCLIFLYSTYHHLTYYILSLFTHFLFENGTSKRAGVFDCLPAYSQSPEQGPVH